MQISPQPLVSCQLDEQTANQHLAIGTQDGRLQVIRLIGTSQPHIEELTPHADAILALAWSEDGKRLITSSRDRTAKLFDASTLELIASYDRHERAVGGAAFLKSRPLSFDETGRVRWMAGDDSDAIVAEQGGLPRVLQQVIVVAMNCSFMTPICSSTQAEKKTVDNGKDDEGQAEEKRSNTFSRARTHRFASGSVDYFSGGK